MKTSTKIWLIIAILSNVGMFYFFRPLVETIRYSSAGVNFVFTVESYVGLALFVIGTISGTIVFVRFLRTQPLSSQIFFSTVPPTITFMSIILFFFTITTAPQTELVSAVRSILAINTDASRYLWVGIVAAIYVVYISIICYLISIPLKRVERAVEVLKYGKARKSIKVGGGKQFKNIEYDLNAINENYKESDKIIKKIDPIIIKEAIEESNAKAVSEPNLIVKAK
jgi:hypothetical protein